MEPHEEEFVRSQTKQVKDVRTRRWLLVVGIIFLLFLFAGGAGAVATYYTLKGAAEEGTELAQQIQQACESPGVTDPDLAQFCPKADVIVEDAPDQVKADPVPGPPGPVGDPGPPGVAGEDAPPLTDTQILDALTRYCTNTGKCRGADGADATATQVALAVSTYCTARGECQGPIGRMGLPGIDGEDATPITQNQIVSAVEDYCTAHNECRGPAGADGQNGSDSNVPGPPGVVNVRDECPPAEPGQVILDIIPTIDRDTQTVTISCTYKDDLTILPPVS